MKEKRDLFNKRTQLLKRHCFRGERLHNNEYHKVVKVWIKNKDNKLLISQRVKEKRHPFMWETTGGSVLSGETEFEACLRESKEELNIDLQNEKFQLIDKTLRYFKNCKDICYDYLIDEINAIQEQDKILITPFFEKIIHKISTE